MRTCHLPEKSRDCVIDEFSPVTVVNEIFTDDLEEILNKILDFDGDDQGFVEMVKKESMLTIGAIVEELEEGFIDGMNDLLPFLKANVSELLKAVSSPSKAALLVAVGVGPIMKYIESAYERFKKEKEEK